MEKRKIYTSESVAEGHPDKVCDQIADAILDACLAKDSLAHVACECMFIEKLLILGGEISFSKPNIYIDYENIAKEVIKEIGYDHEDEGLLNYQDVIIENHIHTQSKEIANAVNDVNIENLGAGDQGIMFGYASDETPSFLPLAHVLCIELVKRASQLRKNGEFKGARPDMKSEVSVQYEKGKNPKVINVVMSIQHDPNAADENFKKYVLEQIIYPVIDKYHLNKDFTPYINVSGSFVLGGPLGDTGLTGRKIIVDTYGGFARHGGGSFSGKDPSKVDRSAAYLARYIAKNLVAAGLAKRLEIELSYVIGQRDALSLMVETFKTSSYSDDYLIKLIRAIFPTRPGLIIKNFSLHKPTFRYRDTSNYSAFFHDELDLPWERLDKVDEIKKYLDLHPYISE